MFVLLYNQMTTSTIPTSFLLYYYLMMEQSRFYCRFLKFMEERNVKLVFKTKTPDDEFVKLIYCFNEIHDHYR
jgi:hypothetical protein